VHTLPFIAASKGQTVTCLHKHSLQKPPYCPFKVELFSNSKYYISFQTNSELNPICTDSIVNGTTVSILAAVNAIKGKHIQGSSCQR